MSDDIKETKDNKKNRKSKKIVRHHIKKDEVVNEVKKEIESKIKKEPKKKEKVSREKVIKSVKSNIDIGVDEFLLKNKNFNSKHNIDDITFLPVYDEAFKPDAVKNASGVYPVKKDVAKRIKDNDERWNGFSDLRNILIRYGVSVEFKFYEGIFN
jgi:hypothetical protein